MRYIGLLLFLSTTLFANFQELCRDLQTARYWDCKQDQRFPMSYSNLLSSGYFITPSARMTQEGMLGFGVASAPPYSHMNVRLQPIPRVELSVSYRIFNGCNEYYMGNMGFGDYMDRGANFKVALATPEESFYYFPGIAFGIEDFMGTSKFLNYFIVATQIWRRYNLETTLGWGAGRYTDGPSKGIYGAISYFPLWERDNIWVRGIGFAAEYDPIDYSNPEREPNPHGREQKYPVNFGLKYNVADIVTMTVGQLRGEALTASGSLSYNWGKSIGLLPKIREKPLYQAPRDTEPLGCNRSPKEMIQCMHYAFKNQGFTISRGWTDCDRLWISVINCRYRDEHVMKQRLEALLAALTPENIDQVVVIIESKGLMCQQYVFPREVLERVSRNLISPFELDVLTPRQNPPSCLPEEMIFCKNLPIISGGLAPMYITFLGSRAGKYKYTAGVSGGIEGYAPGRIFYSVSAIYSLFGTLDGIEDYDFYSPSQLKTVATDSVRYLQEGQFTWNTLFLEKAFTLGKGVFARASLGYFQINYGGVAGELLWYPANRYFALGVEGAVVKKRTYNGLSFQTKLRQLEGYTAHYHKYTTLEQYFVNLYIDFPRYKVATRVSAGQFLARDHGALFEFTRYFDNGVQFGGWITMTDAADLMHGERYFNRGVFLRVPFDLVSLSSCKGTYSRNSAAWLRDAGYATSTGRGLYQTINEERQW